MIYLYCIIIIIIIIIIIKKGACPKLFEYKTILLGGEFNHLKGQIREIFSFFK